MASHISNGTANGDHIGQIRYIPLSYDSTNEPADDDSSARQLILALRPEWSSPDSKVEFVRFTDGITNTLLKAVNRKPGLSKEQTDSEAILLRAYGHGTDVIIDRHRETQNHEQLMKYGLAPKLLARFSNGMMYCFIQGRVCQPADLREPSIYLAVARRIAQWHATVPCLYETNTGNNGLTNGCHDSSSPNLIAPSKPTPNVWTVMQKWIRALPTKTEAQRTRQSELQEQLSWLVDKLSQRPGLGENGLVFAHCDLLSGNVIIEPKGPGTKLNGTSDIREACQDSLHQQPSVNFIDYEYATPSPAAFDLANHFAEWGGFDCDFSVLPTRAQRLEFIREYIHTYFSLTEKKSPENGSAIDEEAEAQRLLAEVDMFRGVPGFYWGIWSLIQATISHIDFDYAQYAEVRLGEYWAWRDAMDGSQKGEVPLREKRWAQLE
ncbi:kinase-like domain-containing protein [Xylaria venustula]|nr:kinase-like domain-containing protein [Xylaria venustula]